MLCLEGKKERQKERKKKKNLEDISVIHPSHGGGEI